jgi:uncharacterized membrane protein YgcG
VVASAPAIDCDSPRYQQWGVVVYFTLIFFVVGAPLGLLYFLRHYNAKGQLFENEFKHRYGVLYDRFIPETYWWVVLTLARRTVLVALAAFIPIRGERFAIISFFQVAFVVSHVMYKPYRLLSENMMGFLSLSFLLVLTISLGSYEFPYSIGVSAFITLLVMVPGLGFAGYMAYEKVRQTFRPTEDEKLKLYEFERGVKRGRRKSRRKFESAGDENGLVDNDAEAEAEAEVAKPKRKLSKRGSKLAVGSSRRRRKSNADDQESSTGSGSGSGSGSGGSGGKKKGKKRDGDDEQSSRSDSGSGSGGKKEPAPPPDANEAKSAADDVDEKSGADDGDLQSQSDAGRRRRRRLPRKNVLQAPENEVETPRLGDELPPVPEAPELQVKKSVRRRGRRVRVGEADIGGEGEA